MRKILLTAATALSLASSTAFAMEDSLYLKASGGASMLNKVNDKTYKQNLKSKTNIVAGLGVGYYVMDNTRVELNFDHMFSPKLERSFNNAGTPTKITHKGKVDALTVNGFVDLADISIAKLFIGAGAGVAQVGEKVTVTGAAPKSESVKKKTSFSYALHAGTSVEFAPGVNGELSYAWKDFGKTKVTKTNTTATKYRGHNLNLGIRFDL